MYNIFKIDSNLIFYFSDIHVGLRGDNIGRLEICEKTIDNIIKIITKLQIKYVIFGGDLFHSRTALNVNTINVAIRFIEKLAEHCTIFLILGNHDIHYKNVKDVHSIKIFNNIKNVHIISSPTELLINNSHRLLMVPWDSDLSCYEDESFDTMCGHFDFSSKYLIASYIEEQTTEYDKNNILTDLIKNDVDQYMSDPTQLYTEDVEKIILNKNTTKSSNYIGSFVDKCKRGGTVFSGHFHGRREFNVKDRNFIIIGAPFEQNFGDVDKIFGFYIQDVKNNKTKFIENKGIPKHKELKISNITETFDYNICTGNYIRPVIDIAVEYNILSDIINKINDAKPVEVFSPEYKVVIQNNNITIGESDNNAGTNLQKAKSGYIIDYITTISNDDLQKDKLNRENLYRITNDYFSLASKKLEIIDNVEK
jgi:DNA repair exonuclease SbcCD nuclease subunit